LNDQTMKTATTQARLTQTYLEQSECQPALPKILQHSSIHSLLHIVPAARPEPDRSVGRHNDPFGGDFLEQIAKAPDKKRNARLRRMKEALRVAVPQLQEIELWRKRPGIPTCVGVSTTGGRRGMANREQFSDGTLRLMGLLWAAMEGGGPLLLEEPELSLHPEIVRVLPQMFAACNASLVGQIFISTTLT